MIVNRKTGQKTVRNSHDKNNPGAILAAKQVRQGFIEYNNGMDYNPDYDNWSYAHQWNYETGRLIGAYNKAMRLGLTWPVTIQYPNRIAAIKEIIRADRHSYDKNNVVKPENKIEVY